MRFFALVVALLLAACNQPLEHKLLPQPAFSDDLLDQLYAAQLVNVDEVLAEKQLLQPADVGGWITRNPYAPATSLSLAQCGKDANCRYALLATGLPRLQFPAAPPVYQWWQQRILEVDNAPVCGLQFLDDARREYRLQTFTNLAALQAEPGYVLTHFQPCGACSSLQDLAIYGELDLTVMAKTCAKRLTLEAKKVCMQDIGFTEPCAETWAYNAQHTAQSCALVCANSYGLMALIKGEETLPPTDADGNLNACLLCDEMMSGPGFQYAAGRIRRNSGIYSEIDRPEDQIYSVPHNYF